MGCPKYYEANWKQTAESLTLVIDPCTSVVVSLNRIVIELSEVDPPDVPVTAVLGEDGVPELREDGGFELEEG
jgi:hypothetical protein